MTRHRRLTLKPLCTLQGRTDQPAETTGFVITATSTRQTAAMTLLPILPAQNPLCENRETSSAGGGGLNEFMEQSVFLFRSCRNGRRRLVRRTQIPASPCQVLESRQLLAATVVQDVPDTAVADSEVSISLSDHFDDPEISGSTAEVVTPLGRILIETYDEITPLTAANFLTLITGGNYEEMFFHRSVPDFVVQGGGYTWSQSTDELNAVADNGNVVNEFDRWFDPQIGGLSAGTPLNLRGTISMAKQANDPDSADTQWFVNLADNSENLDNQNGGFAVFARVLPETMPVVDAIAALPRVNAGNAFSSMPVRDYQSGSGIERRNVVTSTSALVDELTFEVSENSNPNAVTATIVDAELRLTPQNGKSGVSTMTVTATDLNGNVVASTFEVAVRVPLSTTLTGPGNSTDRRPEITWDPSPGADTYELWVNQVGGQNAIIQETALTGTSFTSAAELAAGVYRAWVRVKNAFGKSAWSSVYTFEIEASTPAKVSITSPAAGNVTEVRPLIEWTASAAASEYDLWVNHVGVKNQIIRQQSLTTTSFRPEMDLSDGTYRVWVLAKNEHGDSGWSAPVTFELVSGVLRLIGPAGGSIGARPEFQWSGHDAGGTIELWVNQVGGTNRIIHVTGHSGSSYTAQVDLADGEYKAWIRETVGNSVGSWSSVLNFSVGVDSTPGVVVFSDVANTNTARPTINWQSAANAVRYELWVNFVGGTSRIIHGTSITDLQFTSEVDLASGSYRGWLRAFNADGDSGAWSAAFQFNVT